MPVFKYRLQPLLEQKDRLREQAEEQVAERQKELEAERQGLADLERRRDELIARRDQARTSLFVAAGDQPLTGGELQQRRDHAQALSQDVEAAKDALFSQRLRIEEAEERLQKAKLDLADRKREVEVLEKHRAKLQKRFHREQEEKEALELDEIGNVLYMSKRRPE